MKEVEILLDNRWIMRRKDPETYYRLRDKYLEYQDFFREKLGYRIITNNILVKAEKIPGESEPWMGIGSFEDPMDYAQLCVLLMFLEDLQPEEQFILEQVTDYIMASYPEKGALDWTVFSHRKSLVRVLRFCLEEGLIVRNDGDENVFESGKYAAVLYENTGASKYLMRHFQFEIAKCRETKDFLEMEWQDSERDRGTVRRNRVFRKLVMGPVVYQSSPDDQDYLYIKNQRSYLSNDIEKYIPGYLHIHKNGAMVMLSEGNYFSDVFPGRKNISDIAMQMCNLLREQLGMDKVARGSDDSYRMSYLTWDSLLDRCIIRNKAGWSKQYRENTSFIKLKSELMEYMEGFGLMRFSDKMNEVTILPGAFKLAGKYPRDFQEKLASAKESRKAVLEETDLTEDN